MDELEVENKVEDIIKLLESKKINELRQYLDTINSADFPSILEKFEPERIIILYRLLDKDKAAEVFVEMDSDTEEQLINLLTDKEIKTVMNELYMDDAADLIGEMPANVVKRILANTKSEDRKIINELLKYPDDTAGSMMTTEFIDLKETMTVKDAFDFIKRRGLRKETVYNCYVLSKDRKLLGVVDIKEILAADLTEYVKDIMDTNIIKTHTLEDREEVIKMFDKYDFVAIPVVDKEERLVGIITIDDAMDVMQEETDEDFEKMAGITPIEDTYFKTSVFVHAKNRIIWLLLLMVSSMITGAIIEKYEVAIATLPVLVAFIPLLMDTGGNCGSQSSTLIIRGLAMDEIEPRDILKCMWKECRVSLYVGIVLAIVNTIRVMIQFWTEPVKGLLISAVVSLSLIATVLVAKLLGCILPIVAKKIKLDPAIMASPIITTIADLTSVMMFFNFATVILSQYMA